ncbi:AbgT family transporter [Tsuneonella sp. YG55]|uniref:AbgT family transporter n=1 Tax=Tsuneonella litorea TaxID=2976475 RepID=A0A9X3AA46_9SPHN|nr:AbgT family transporter [Tsuneonella litorea]MCT2559545.1 AbgT family transporter [Tsuneonella litorea]
MGTSTAAPAPRPGFLGWVERVGNRLPDPVFIFVWLIAGLVIVSVLGALAGWSALHPTELDAATGQPRLVMVASLLSAENIRLLWTETPRTFTAFAPLGYVLVVMFGAGVAERVGLLSTAMRLSMANVPRRWMTPAVALVSMMGNHAADAAFVVFVPLCGIIYHAAGRHPLLGVGASFASIAGGFSANLLPGQLDALLLGLTEAAVTSAFGDVYTANIAGNWYFIAAMTVLYLPIIWYVTDRVVEPRLGKYDPALRESSDVAALNQTPDERGQKTGLRRAGLALLAVLATWLLCIFGPGTPLIDETAGEGRLSPLYNSLLALFMLIFLVPAWTYGKATGAIADHRDLVKMLTGAMQDMGYYLVLVFVAAHFVAMFAWSNLGIVIAVNGADALRESGLPAWAMVGSVVVFGSALNMIIGSASAKWAVIGPALVPMLMLLGISPEMSTAAYRAGDSATNMITPVGYLPIMLIFCRRWVHDYGFGSFVAIMLPYAGAILVAATALTIGWVVLDLPLGPGAGVFIEPGATVAPLAPAAPG